MTEKDKYRQLCKFDKNIPVFSKDWWMDAVCGEDNWDVLLVEDNNGIKASMPIYLKKKFGLKYITQPQFTQNNGIHIIYPKNQKYEKKLSYEKEVMDEIINKLDNLGLTLYQQAFHYTITNCLPFYWRGFEHKTYYTYVIEDISNIDIVYNAFSHAKRKNIKRALNEVEVKFDLDPLAFYENHKMTLSKQNSEIIYSYDILKRMVDYSYENNSGRILYAIDNSGNIHSAIFVIWDDESAFDLISTIDPDFRNSGSASLLVYEAIKYVSLKTKRFDFEGSMIENVENSFRQFGTKQRQYFTISKVYKFKPLVDLFR